MTIAVAVINDLLALEGLPEKLGLLGTMLLILGGLLLKHLQAAPAKHMGEWTPTSLSLRLTKIETRIEKLDEDSEKHDRVIERLHDYETVKERVIRLWDRDRRSSRDQYAE
jgi:hypothetical protein